MKIKQIEISHEVVPTYDIEVPEEHHYNCEGLVSHNSSIVSNATNGIEPPRGLLSIKKSKKGPIKQIVPQYYRLKNQYTLLWNMKSNEGYFNIVAMIQKFFDQTISSNWNYNPENYPNKEIPMSVMVKDFISFYNLGHKTAYYQNTYDGKTENYNENETNVDDIIEELYTLDDEQCDSCAI